MASQISEETLTLSLSTGFVSQAKENTKKEHDGQKRDVRNAFRVTAKARPQATDRLGERMPQRSGNSPDRQSQLQAGCPDRGISRMRRSIDLNVRSTQHVVPYVHGVGVQDHKACTKRRFLTWARKHVSAAIQPQRDYRPPSPLSTSFGWGQLLRPYGFQTATFKRLGDCDLVRIIIDHLQIVFYRLEMLLRLR